MTGQWVRAKRQSSMDLISGRCLASLYEIIRSAGCLGGVIYYELELDYLRTEFDTRHLAVYSTDH